MTELDLFGQEISAEPPPIMRDGKRRPTPKKGYAAAPGTGPAGETCKTCRHLARLQYAKVYLKCALRRPTWTGGPGTDILAKSPACEKWERLNHA